MSSFSIHKNLLSLSAFFLSLSLLFFNILLAEFSIVDISLGQANFNKKNKIFTKLSGNTKLEIAANPHSNNDGMKYLYRCVLDSSTSFHKEAITHLLNGNALSDTGGTQTGNGILGAFNRVLFGLEAGEDAITCYVHYFKDGLHECIKNQNCDHSNIIYMKPEQYQQIKELVNNPPMTNIHLSRPHLDPATNPWDTSMWEKICGPDGKYIPGHVASHLPQECGVREKPLLVVAYRFPFYVAPAYYEVRLDATSKHKAGATPFKSLNSSGELMEWPSGQKMSMPILTAVGARHKLLPSPVFDPEKRLYRELVLRTNEELNITVISYAKKGGNADGYNASTYNSQFNQLNFLAIDGRRVESSLEGKPQNTASKKARVNKVASKAGIGIVNMMNLYGDTGAVSKNACVATNHSNKAGQIAFGNKDPLSHLISMDVPIKNGLGSKSFTISFNDVVKGTLRFTYTDLNLYERIMKEESEGKCGFSGLPCPYPPFIEFSIPFSVIPDGFHVSLGEVASGNKGKYIYFGAGAGDDADGIQLSAVRANNAKAKHRNYTHMCASMDMNISLGSSRDARNSANKEKFKGVGSADIALRLKDEPSNDIVTIPEAKFKQGELEEKNKLVLAYKDGNKLQFFSPEVIENPAYFEYMELSFANKKVPAQWPVYRVDLDALAIRPRLNLIDGDNSADFSALPVTKAYYEFYCGAKPRPQSNECNDELLTLLKERLGEGIIPSPTAHNWAVNPDGRRYPLLRAEHISVDGGVIMVKEVKQSTSAPYDEINYALPDGMTIKDAVGRHKVRVRTGATDRMANSGAAGVGGARSSSARGGAASGAASAFTPYPLYMLYNPYYEQGSWGVNSFFDIYPVTTNKPKSHGASTPVPPTKGKSRIFSD